MNARILSWSCSLTPFSLCLYAMIMKPPPSFGIGIFWASVSISALEMFRSSTQFWEKLGLGADRYRLFRKVFNEYGEDREWTELLALADIGKLLIQDNAMSFWLDCNYKLPMIHYSEVPDSSDLASIKRTGVLLVEGGFEV